MWHKYLGKSDSTTADWEEDDLQNYDRADKGKSALVTAALLSLKAEVAVILGMFLLSVFRDINNFFDSVDLNILFGAIMQKDFPKGTFVLAIAQHLAPRLLVLGAYCGIPQNGSSSILAGCFMAVASTRCCNKREFSSIQDQHKPYGVGIDLYVDDANEYAAHDEPQDVAVSGYHAAVSFANGIKALN